jgi:hypothetical protein
MERAVKNLFVRLSGFLLLSARYLGSWDFGGVCSSGESQGRVGQ